MGSAGTPGRRRWPSRVVLVVLVLAGVVVTSWPIGTRYVEDHRAGQEAAELDRTTEAIPPRALARAISQARRYNARLGPETLRDPWTERGVEGSADQARYLDQLADLPAMGSLDVPAIGVRLPIRHNASDESMHDGVGHFFGTSLPVGGRGSHAVLATHTGMAHATLFDRLPELVVGDEFRVTTHGEVLTYRVDRISTVLPTDFDEIQRVPGKDLVTLLTCVPRLVNSHRLLVRGVRVHDASDAEAASSGAPARFPDLAVQDWMLPRLALSAVALGLLAMIMTGWVVGDARRRRARRRTSAHA